MLVRAGRGNKTRGNGSKIENKLNRISMKNTPVVSVPLPPHSTPTPSSCFVPWLEGVWGSKLVIQKHDENQESEETGWESEVSHGAVGGGVVCGWMDEWMVAGCCLLYKEHSSRTQGCFWGGRGARARAHTALRSGEVSAAHTAWCVSPRWARCSTKATVKSTNARTTRVSHVNPQRCFFFLPPSIPRPAVVVLIIPSRNGRKLILPCCVAIFCICTAAGG